MLLAKGGEEHETDYLLHRWSEVQDARLFCCLALTHSVTDVLSCGFQEGRRGCGRHERETKTGGDCGYYVVVEETWKCGKLGERNKSRLQTMMKRCVIKLLRSQPTLETVNATWTVAHLEAPTSRLHQANTSRLVIAVQD